MLLSAASHASAGRVKGKPAHSAPALMAQPSQPAPSTGIIYKSVQINRLPWGLSAPCHGVTPPGRVGCGDPCAWRLAAGARQDSARRCLGGGQSGGPAPPVSSTYSDTPAAQTSTGCPRQSAPYSTCVPSEICVSVSDRQICRPDGGPGWAGKRHVSRMCTRITTHQTKKDVYENYQKVEWCLV